MRRTEWKTVLNRKYKEINVCPGSKKFFIDRQWIKTTTCRIMGGKFFFLSYICYQNVSHIFSSLKHSFFFVFNSSIEKITLFISSPSIKTKECIIMCEQKVIMLNYKKNWGKRPCNIRVCSVYMYAICSSTIFMQRTYFIHTNTDFG